MGRRFKSWVQTNRELVLGLVWGFATLALWVVEPYTALTRQENLIITIALFILDVVFIFFSLLFRRVSQALERRDGATNLNSHTKFNEMLNQTTEERVNKLIVNAISSQYETDLALLKLMAQDGKYLVGRGEWYLETMKLCKAIQVMQGEIMAVSAYNIEDFMTDDNAKNYLKANAEAIKRGTNVRRMFIIDSTDLDRGDIIYILREHANQLTPDASAPNSAKDSGVKFIPKRYAGDDKTQDFVLFYPYVVVRQRPGGTYLEVSQLQVEVEEAHAAFTRLWQKPTAKLISQITSNP